MIIRENRQEPWLTGPNDKKRAGYVLFRA